MDYRIKEEEEKRKNISNKIFNLKKDYISQASMVRGNFSKGMEKGTREDYPPMRR